MDLLKKENKRDMAGAKLIIFKSVLLLIKLHFRIKKCLKEKNGII